MMLAKVSDLRDALVGNGLSVHASASIAIIIVLLRYRPGE